MARMQIITYVSHQLTYGSPLIYAKYAELYAHIIKYMHAQGRGEN